MKLAMVMGMALGAMALRAETLDGDAGGGAAPEKVNELATALPEVAAESVDAAKPEADAEPTPAAPEAAVANASLDAPAAHVHETTDMATRPSFVHGDDGALCIVKKGNERIPVQVKDEAHYNRLVEEHGRDNVEVQS